MAAGYEDYEYLERQLDGGAGSQGAPEPNVTSDPGPSDRPKKSRRSRSRSRDRRKRRSRSRSKDRERDRERDRRRRSRSRDKERERERDRDRERRRSRSRERHGLRRREGTPPEERIAKDKDRELRELERATRTVFAYNLNLKADERDIFKFFGQAGTVTDIKLITDKNTKRSKGMAYVEFKKQEDVITAMSILPGQLLLNMPVMIKASEVEKNLAWEAQQAAKQQQNNRDAASSLLSAVGGASGGTSLPAGLGSCRLQVTNLHPDMEDVDLKDAFEPFGFLESIQVVKDPASGRSAGYGYVQYREYGDGVKAMQHWNGKQLGGRALQVQIAPLPATVPMVVPPVLPPELTGLPAGMPPALAAFPGMGLPGMAVPGMLGAPLVPTDPAAAAAALAAAAVQQQKDQQVVSKEELDEVDDEGKGGLKLDAQKRVALMQRLAAAAGLETAKPAMPILQQPAAAAAPAMQVAPSVMLEQGVLGPASPIPTQTILLKNMFDPAEEESRGDPNWVAEVESDVKEECSRFGEVLHCHVDRNSKGFVYLKFAAQQAAEAAHRALNLRWYSGKQILCEYQFVAVYNSYFGLR
mmetsp:Transcript_26889/g.58686  ORF Transcript_26889/g.58686 Transcript_26889/m.58686 type:complete len:583 (+) Transcript_26889:130-1878(+)|eukprot:CAMPEP_0202920378 /NCGR_PEP_ID=MMETSP1392-20130828/76825_1 /ASSEMBLY_ACC=CAM_ASM_000868 /TAXON_ID=225041 /ORGANISM="Chlamydomonas chlamydogama, Strain SAG 11-48b" /LENGTH=582 /DNA_ID=CAMNT_0049613871 /DNA_START=124 /DNA_END=1872 /DNA_ORIENTATION=+